METKFKKGDIITINDKKWTISDITMKYGIQHTYGLERENKNGDREHMNIETGSLETMIGDNR